MAVRCACWRFRAHHLADAADDEVGVVVVLDAAARRADEPSWRRAWDATGEAVAVEIVADERALVAGLRRLVARLDPDVLLGWDTARGSWGYVEARWGVVAPSDRKQLFSRDTNARADRGDRGRTYAAARGRVVVGGRAAVRGDALLVRLLSHDLAAVAIVVLKRRAPPTHDRAELAQLFAAPEVDARVAAVTHVLAETTCGLEIVAGLDVVGRAAELGRLLGMPLADALTRGSQHRVEAILLGVAKPRRGANPLTFLDARGDERPPPGATWYALRSPSRADVAAQPAIEETACILEPVSAIYTDPVACLDYQSLYPSMIVAHNLCFSTCVGRLAAAGPPRAAGDVTKRPDGDASDSDSDSKSAASSLDGAPQAARPRDPAPAPGAATTGRLGVVAHWPAAEAARALKHAEASGPVYVAPNGAVFAGPAAREGALPRMLREVLAARFLTKQALKRARAARRGTLARVLDARQLALKLVANVTYGYCAASFSGRQPCADLADAIVASGRSCLEDAVGVAGGAGAAKPVKYGDTDSIFVEMAGASVAQALDRAHEISKTVFAGTPPAVHLKVEYVFDGCALVSKKRYVGRAVEAPGDTPHLLVKGLELKTRDQCDFVRERLEAVVRDVLATRDLSRAKRTLQRAVVGVEACPLQDLILWRRYRGEGAYKTNRHDLVGPVKELDARGNRTAAKDRVGYVVVKDPGLKLYQRTHAATHEAGLALRVDRTFYIVKKLLPPLSRILDVCGVNVFAWYQATPKPARRARLPAPDARRTGQTTMDDHFPSRNCIHCGVVAAKPPICDACAARPDFLAVEHFIRERGLERRRWELERSLAVAGLGPRALPAGLHLAPSKTSLEDDRTFEYRRVLDAIEDNDRRWLATLEVLERRKKRRRDDGAGPGRARRRV